MFVDKSILAACGVIAATVSPVVAQQTQVFDGQDAAADQVEAVEDAVSDDFKKARDVRKFGNRPYQLGWYGSVSATAGATSGNTDTANLGLGAKFGQFDGTNAHDWRLSYKYAETNGKASANSAALGYDYNRFFNQNFYGFGKLSTKYDEFGAFTRDSFAGVGVGYRLVNTGSTSWAVQAGPGYRITEDANGTGNEEWAGSLDSKLYHALNENVFLTNDTSVLFSDADTAVSNELGVNVAVGRSLALRTSLRTEWHSDPLPGRKDTDNALRLSLVYTLR